MSGSRSRLEVGGLALYSAVFLVTGGMTCREMRLWLDELITAYLARLPSLTALWRCLLDATDNNPPLYHLAVRLSVAALGDGALAIRLPALLGFWLFTLCVYRFVRARCEAAYAWTALFLVVASGAGTYACEARPYGLVLAGCGLSLVGWQAATGAGARWLGLWGIAFGLAMAVASHYYSVLLVVPLAAGELARCRIRRRLDIPILLAFTAGLAAILPCRPLIAPIRALQKSFWAKPEPLSISNSYTFLIGPTAPILALSAVALGGLLALGPRAHDRDDSAQPTHEVVAILTLAAYPFLVFLLALTVTRAYVDRYTLPAVAGLAIVAALSADRLAGGSRRIGTLLATVALVGAITARLTGLVRDLERFIPPEQMIQPLALATERGPIVVGNPDLYLQLTYYAPRHVTDRLIYLEAQQNTAEEILKRLERWAPLRVRRFPDYLRTLPADAPVYLYGRSDDWLANTMPMIADRMEVLYDDVRRILFRITLDPVRLRNIQGFPATMRPPTIVQSTRIARSSSSEQRSGSRSTRIRSASLPGSTLPFSASSP